MAPANGSSKSRKTNNVAAPTSKPAPKKPVVPALPLKRHAATPSSVSSNNTVAGLPKSDKKLAKPDAKAEQPTKGYETARTELQTPDPSAQPEVTSASSDKQVEAQNNSQAQAPPSVPASSESAATPKVDTPTTSSTDESIENQPAAAASTNAQEQTGAQTTDINSMGEKQDPRQKPSVDHSAKPFRPRVPPAVSPTRFQMPPAFRPNNVTMAMPGNGDLSRGPRGQLPAGPPHGHQAHPSNSSIHFGTFHDSQTSSPAPPPGMPFPDGRQPFMGPGGPGFPPMMPYGNEMMPMATFDNFGRPSMPYGPMDPYPPYRGNMGHGPSGPHSFHGSQSSNADESAMYNQYSRPPHRNGAHGQAEENQHPNPRMYRGPEYSQSFPNQDMPPPTLQRPEYGEEFVQYFQQQFGNPEFADFTLELRYVDDRAAPVRIPGHRIIFAKSQELAEQLRRQTLPPSPSGSASQTLLLETGSKWIRSDSFYMATQTLYGIPLLENQGARNVSESADIADAGSNGEQLEFALSYAAAGHLLGWTPVVRRGCEVASQLLNWQTVERVLEFALDSYTDKGLHDSYKYGEGSKMLLDAIVNFIVHKFPPTFELDANVAEPVQYARLPINPGPAPIQSQMRGSEVTEPTEAGSSPSVQFGKGRRSQKITGIQFGDFASPESKPTLESETPKASKQAQPVSHSVLSRLLLNIPFTQLKTILESSSSGNVQGWANAEARYRIVKTAVDEREALRRRVIDAVTAGRVADTAAILNTLRAPEPRDSDGWGIVGWQEEILPYGNADGPSLGRKWAPLVEFQAPPVAAYP